MGHEKPSPVFLTTVKKAHVFGFCNTPYRS
jgi:hypothetical protein